MKPQEEEELRAGYKFGLKLIRYKENIMNVKLVVQTLSMFVYNELMHMKKQPENDFKDVDGTANFVWIFNNIFDILKRRLRSI